MITRVREVEGGYKVTLLTAEGEVDSRETASLAEAFGWQAHASANGALPETVEAPAKKKGRGK